MYRCTKSLTPFQYFLQLFCLQDRFEHLGQEFDQTLNALLASCNILNRNLTWCPQVSLSSISKFEQLIGMAGLFRSWENCLPPSRGIGVEGTVRGSSKRDLFRPSSMQRRRNLEDILVESVFGGSQGDTGEEIRDFYSQKPNAGRSLAFLFVWRQSQAPTLRCVLFFFCLLHFKLREFGILMNRCISWVLSFFPLSGSGNVSLQDGLYTDRGSSTIYDFFFSEPGHDQ